MSCRNRFTDMPEERQLKPLHLTLTLWLTIGCSTEESSTRGQNSSDTIAETLSPETADSASMETEPESSPDEPIEAAAASLPPELTLTDIFLYLGDDGRGLVDSSLADISSDELKEAINEDLLDNGLTDKMISLFLEFADTDGSGGLDFFEFLNASIDADGQEEAVKVLVKDDKQAVFNFIDLDHNGFLEAENIASLVQVRVWKLRAWIAEDVDVNDPDRLHLLVASGFNDLQALVVENYGSGILDAATIAPLMEGVRTNMSP